MEERRQHPRRQVDEEAYIFGDGSSIRCSITNISEVGAAINLPTSCFVPDQFQLMIAKDRTVRSCRIVWTAQNRMGTQFITPTQRQD